MPRKEIRVCQILLAVKVRVAGQGAVRVAVPARAAEAVLARDPADFVSVRLVARRRPISREFPASKSNVPNAGQ
jgi:hypothetical protein